MAIATEAVALFEKSTFTEQSLGLCDVSVGPDGVPLQERGTCTDPGPVRADVAAGPDAGLSTAEKSTGTEAGPVLVHVAAGSESALVTKDESTATEQRPITVERAAGPEKIVTLHERSVGTGAIEMPNDEGILPGPGLDTSRGSPAAGLQSVKSVVKTEEKGTGTEGLSEVSFLLGFFTPWLVQRVWKLFNLRTLKY